MGCSESLQASRKSLLEFFKRVNGASRLGGDGLDNGARILAEQYALLDAASGGRAIIGVSPGWQQEEFAIVGLDYSRRIGRFTEAVDLIRRLYTEDQVTFDGKHFRTSKATLA
jgi:alkanesulfonate monooxygenase SsuD/methylene tetrahydromethanopterin reductase-like flavin-dependent oxidoreductase (luciferase family)